MKLKSHLLSIGALLSMAIPAVAAPYLVYSGTISQTSTISPSTATDAKTNITNHATAFHKLNATLQKDINAYLTAKGGTSSTTAYLIVDTQNVSQYTFVLLDPTKTGKKIPSIVTSNLSAAAQQQNFLSGFDFATKGGLGLFRLSITRNAGNDPISGLPITYLLQGDGTGALTTAAGTTIAAKRAAASFFLVVNGVKGSKETTPAFPAITLPSDTVYMPTISGSLFGYYFDDATTQSLGGASTRGSFTLTVDESLTQLANQGGAYVASTRNIGLITPISASTTAAYKTWAESLIAVATGH
jgi:hypothetical protein